MEKRNRHQAAQQAQFNIQRRMKIGVASAAAVATLFVAGKSFGANGTWVGGGADTNWTTSGNWTGGTIPGANDGTFISTDTATFGDLTSNGLTAPVISDLNRNVKNITYSSASGFPPQYTIGSALTVNTPNPNNPLYLTGGGELLVSSNINTATGSNDGINDPLFIEGSTYTFEDDSPFNTVGGIKINGAVTGSPTSPTTLTLQGSNYGTTQGQSGNAQFNGVISDGAGGPLSIVKNGASGSVWEIDNASTTPNSFTGSVTINAGAIRFKNAGDLPSTAVVTVGSTGVLRLGAGFSIPSITINSDGGTGGTSGVDILTLITSTGPALTLQLEATGVAQPSISTPFILAGTGAAGSGGVQVNGDATFTDKVSLGTAMDLGGVNRIFNINTLGTNDTDLQLGGVISDTGGAGGGGIIKTGVGSLKLNNVAETFTGPIEVQNGVLKLIGTTTANTLGGLNALTIDGGNFNLNPDGVTAGDGNTTVASTNFTSGSISGATPTAATIQTPASLLAPSFNFNVGLGNTFTANAVLANGTGGPSPLITNAASAGTAILNKANTPPVLSSVPMSRLRWVPPSTPAPLQPTAASRPAPPWSPAETFSSPPAVDLPLQQPPLPP